jgi:hypothetical protein
MSTRNGPSARAHATERDHGTDELRSSATARQPAARYSRAEYAKLLAVQDELARADGDYQRLRNAYVELAETEPSHDVALAMIGADMDRAHARLQALIGLPRLPFTHEPSAVIRRETQRLAEEKR